MDQLQNRILQLEHELSSSRDVMEQVSEVYTFMHLFTAEERAGLAASMEKLFEVDPQLPALHDSITPSALVCRESPNLAHRAELDSDKFGDSWLTKPAGLIESCWVSAPDPS